MWTDGLQLQHKQENAMAAEVEDCKRFHGARLCFERVLSHSGPKKYIVYSSKGSAHCSKCLSLSLSILSVLCPSRTCVILAYLRCTGHIDAIWTFFCMQEHIYSCRHIIRILMYMHTYIHIYMISYRYCTYSMYIHECITYTYIHICTHRERQCCLLENQKEDRG